MRTAHRIALAIAAACVLVTGVTGSGGASVPSELLLEQNYPNPFNPSTVIRFGVPAGGGETKTELRVFDLLGRQVAELVNGQLSPGIHSVMWNPIGMATGVYYEVLRSGRSMVTRKMILIR